MCAGKRVKCFNTVDCTQYLLSAFITENNGCIVVNVDAYEITRRKKKQYKTVFVPGTKTGTIVPNNNISVCVATIKKFNI